MDIGLLIRGMVIGFSIAAPVGPIGVLCIRQTLTHGRAAGIACGLGAATADAVYGCVAAFGLVTVSYALVAQQGWLLAVGGVFLCYLGVRTFLSRPPEDQAPTRGPGLVASWAATFVLTLTNPMTILFFAAIFIGLGLPVTSGSWLAAGLLVLGVFLGSAVWWLTLSTLVAAARHRLNPRALIWVNRICGIIIMGFGVVALAGAVVGHV